MFLTKKNNYQKGCGRQKVASRALPSTRNHIVGKIKGQVLSVKIQNEVRVGLLKICSCHLSAIFGYVSMIRQRFKCTAFSCGYF